MMDDLYDALCRALEGENSIRNNVGRMGHVLGMQLTELLSHMQVTEPRL